MRSSNAIGAMGEVYDAADSKLRREVAIKVRREAFRRDFERLARFEREARVEIGSSDSSRTGAEDRRIASCTQYSGSKRQRASRRPTG